MGSKSMLVSNSSQVFIWSKSQHDWPTFLTLINLLHLRLDTTWQNGNWAFIKKACVPKSYLAILYIRQHKQKYTCCSCHPHFLHLIHTCTHIHTHIHTYMHMYSGWDWTSHVLRVEYSVSPGCTFWVSGHFLVLLLPSYATKWNFVRCGDPVCQRTGSKDQAHKLGETTQKYIKIPPNIKEVIRFT